MQERRSKVEKSNPRWIDIKVAKQILLGTVATGDEASLELGRSVSTLRVSGTSARGTKWGPVDGK